ncbi:MAG: tetratricopeptide repeat protein [Desulfobacterales bacterium]|nr:tetratricopeptide repeat protein [Pseudomonadota bacterium]MBU4356285.1 tetratricopeptide repeat protein [Pseudomonadota bacterium]MCG2770628.1 tetratricopeptide repeat protein [Desulfobacterales bacterium]
MAKITPRRRLALDNPEEVYSLAQRLLAPLKPYAKWLVLAGVVIAVGLGAWGINAKLQERREDKAVAALALVTPKADLKAPDVAAAQALEKFINENTGTRAAREAQLTRANLLYRLKQYGEAAKAYESLLDGRDPGWDTLVNESISYCYEGMGNFKKAAAVLKPVVEQSSGPLQKEVMRRLAMLYEQAKEPKEAAVLWRKLLDQPPDAAMVPYLQEKLAAAEAGSTK